MSRHNLLIILICSTVNDLHAGMQWIPLVPEQNNILPYSARLKSTQKSVNPGLVRASATFTLEFQ